METRQKGPVAAILRYVSALRFPWLLAVAAALFVIDLLLPDIIPFADELLLGLLTLVLAAWRKRKDTRAATVPGRTVDPPLPPVPDGGSSDAKQLR
jgi:hypothetical protein